MSQLARFEDWVPFRLERVFLFFANPENLPRLMPPQLATRVDRLDLVPPPGSGGRTATGLAGVGTEVVTSFRILPPLPFRARWIARITEFEWNHHFADIQAHGPFKSWQHRHEFAADTRGGIDGTIVRDQIEYSIGFGPLADLAERAFIGRQMRATFARRQQALQELLATP